MIDEHHNGDDAEDRNSFSGIALNRLVVLLLVTGIYLFIFLKILVLP